jgi:hypothetical protein
MGGYTCIAVCPVTGERLNFDDIYYNSGVCVSCGDISGSTRSHHASIVGQWVRRPGWRGWFQDPVWVEKKDG